MELAHLHNVPDGDHLPELPLGTTAPAYGNAAVHYLDSPDDSHNFIPHSPHDAGEGATHVSLGHFDPSGVDELKRTMSLMSERRAPLADATSRPSHDTDHTLSPGDGPFDFEKSLQQIVRRCVATSQIYSEVAHCVCCSGWTSLTLSGVNLVSFLTTSE